MFVVMGLLMISSIATASYAGPFLLWGTENLNSMKTPTLQGEKLKIFLKENFEIYENFYFSDRRQKSS